MRAEIEIRIARLREQRHIAGLRIAAMLQLVNQEIKDRKHAKAKIQNWKANRSQGEKIIKENQ